MPLFHSLAVALYDLESPQEPSRYISEIKTQPVPLVDFDSRLADGKAI
jgi:hypothetical protein